MKKITLDYCIFVLGLVILLILFSWAFYSCLYFSDSFDILPIKTIDELIFQRTLLNGREHMHGSAWITVFAITDYGYGNIFWSPLILLSWLIVHWGPEWLLIVLPRWISVGAYAWALYMFFRVGRLRSHSLGNCMLGVLLIATCRGMFSSSIYFHNNTLIPAFIMTSLYFLSLPRTRKAAIWGSVFFGAAVATKITALFALPIFFLFFNRELPWSQLLNLQTLKRNLKAGAQVFASAIFFFSPTVLLLPIGVMDFFTHSVESLRYILFLAPRSPKAPTPEFFYDIYSYNSSNYFRGPVMALGVFLALWLLIKFRHKTLNVLLLSLVTIVSLLMMILLTNSAPRNPYFLKFYVIPLVFTFAFVFLDAPRRFKSISSGLILAIAMNLFFGGRDLSQDLVLTPTILNSTYSQQRIQSLPILREKLKLLPNEIINLDFTLILPLGPIEAYKKVLYFYTPGESLHVKADVYVISKQNEIAVETSYFNSPEFEKIYEDEVMKVFRRNSNSLIEKKKESAAREESLGRAWTEQQQPNTRTSSSSNSRRKT
jgi:hypothetical protein